MPVLKWAKWVIAVALVFGGWALWERGSPAYRHIKALPWQEWDRYAATLPIEDRLDLHKEIEARNYHRGEHIFTAFADRPRETYKAITRRLSQGDKSQYYSSIIYEIDGQRGFRICSQPDRRVVQTYMHEITGYPDSLPPPDDHTPLPDFFSC